MQRGHRLSRSRDFDAVYRHGRSVSTRFLVLYWFERENGDGDAPRLGVAVPKKVGGSVIRNRIKRRLREAFRLHCAELEPRWDIVVNPRRTVLKAPFTDIEQALRKVIDRCNAG